jgi:hypothetical protein
MKRSILLLLIILVPFACKKEKNTPEGSTDVGVKNSSGIKLTEVIVNTSGGIETLGDINPGGFSEHFRFDKAFPKAEISGKVKGEPHSTPSVNYNGMTYIGQAKITYEVVIPNASNKTFEISNCSLDAPLD